VTSTDLELRLAKLTFTTAQRLRTWQMMAVMLQNKIGIDQILAELYDRASDGGEKPKDTLAMIYAEWRTSILNGGRFADAINGWVPTMERMVIMSGEQSGNLPKAFESVIEIVETNRKVQSAVLGGLFYPTILIMATIGYLFLFGIKVIPEFTRILDVSTWGPLAKSLHTLSMFTINYGVFLIVGVIAMVVAVAVTMPMFTGPFRIRLDKLPPWSLYRLVVGSGFLFALSALLNGGMRIKDALVAIKGTATPYLNERIEAYLYGINGGQNAGDAMKNAGYNFPSKDIVADLGIYSKYSGDFGDALDRVGKQWMRMGLQTIQAQMKVLNGMAIAFMALVLMWIVAGFFAIQQEIASLSRNM